MNYSNHLSYVSITITNFVNSGKEINFAKSSSSTI